MNNALFEEQRLIVVPEFFPHLTIVDVGGVQQVQLAQQPAIILQNILFGLGYESEWDADRTVLVITNPGEQDGEPLAQVTIEQTADGDEYEFVVRGSDEEVVDLVADSGPGGVMDQLTQFIQGLWNAGQPIPNAPVAPVAPVAPIPVVAQPQNENNENIEMEGGRRRRQSGKSRRQSGRRRTMRRKARKTRKARRSHRRTLYRKRR